MRVRFSSVVGRFAGIGGLQPGALLCVLSQRVVVNAVDGHPAAPPGWADALPHLSVIAVVLSASLSNTNWSFTSLHGGFWRIPALGFPAPPFLFRPVLFSRDIKIFDHRRWGACFVAQTGVSGIDGHSHHAPSGAMGSSSGWALQYCAHIGHPDRQGNDSFPVSRSPSVPRNIVADPYHRCQMALGKPANHASSC